MRDSYHEELGAIPRLLVEMTGLVQAALATATRALLEADLALAEQVISGDGEIDELSAEVETRAFELLARQQPVAIDLRTIIASLRMVVDLERCGDLAAHIAQLARRRYPAHAVPESVHATIRDMDRVARGMLAKAGEAIATGDPGVAAAMEADDDVMDQLHRGLFRRMLDPDWHDPVETAVDLVLCSRFYERLADHAVSTVRRVVYLVTGEPIGRMRLVGGTPG